MTRDQWLRQIDFLIDIFEQKGYEVLQYTDAPDHVLLNSAVFINSRVHPERRFYTMLHELGHVIINQNHKEFEKGYPLYARTTEFCSDGRKQRRADYRVSIVAEEIDAWKEGLKFAEDNELFINESKYKKDMTESVLSYINWASDETY
tara:strand:+ start:399 stop:842 length:444 start_codon:yes stop_codon:yes gene_type:complete